MAADARASFSLTGIVAAIFFSFATAAMLGANDAQATEPTPREVIREVLAAPEFQEYRNEKVWQRRSNEQDSPDWDFGAIARLLEFLSDVFAGFFRVAVYACLAVGAFFLLRYLVRNIDRWQRTGAKGADRAPPDVLFGLDVRPEALPENLAQLAAAAAESDPHLALSLLYRGALATLIHRDRIDFAAGDTESDCMRRVDHAAPAPLCAYFRRLVQAWSEAAYAKRTAGAPSIRTLCDEWQMHFSAETIAA